MSIVYNMEERVKKECKSFLCRLGNIYELKAVVTIGQYSPLQLNEYCSDPFLIGGCKWRIFATPKGNNLEFSYLYLGVANPKSFPSRWTSDVDLSFAIVDNLSNHSIVKDSQLYFDEKSLTCCYPILDLPPELLVEDRGYLVKGKLTVVLRVFSHDYKATETLGESDNSRRIEENHGSKTDDLLSETQELKVNVINGFQVFPPQIRSVKRILERYPDIASEVRPKNQCLRTGYMNVILGVIETLCQLPEELSNDDLEEATVALSFVAKGGFKVDWLEKKLEEVKEKKKKMDNSEAQLQQFEEEMCRLKNLVDKENADVSAAKVPFSFDDVVCKGN